MPNPSRRAVLGAGAFLTAAGVGTGLGFGRSIHHKVAIPPPAPPANLTSALSAHRELVDLCDAGLAADPAAAPKLAPLRADLIEHADALGAVLETYPGWRFEQSVPSAAAPGASNSASPAPTVAAVSAAVQRQAAQLSATCVGWPLPDAAPPTVVPLLGSIAACLTVHVGLLA